MPALSKTVLFCLFLLMLLSPSCTYYTEKQTEAVSQTVYATKDSIDKARFDLADEYSTQATRLVKPPKTRIEIAYLNASVPQSQSKTDQKSSKPSKTPVVVIPERLRGMTVIVVNSDEYKNLLQDKEALEQLKLDFVALNDTKKEVDQELITQIKFRDKMVNDLNNMKETIANKNLVIIKLSLTSAALGMALAAGVVLKFKGII
jgi:hypothetical protein